MTLAWRWQPGMSQTSFLSQPFGDCDPFCERLKTTVLMLFVPVVYFTGMHGPCCVVKVCHSLPAGASSGERCLPSTAGEGFGKGTSFNWFALALMLYPGLGCSQWPQRSLPCIWRPRYSTPSSITHTRAACPRMYYTWMHMALYLQLDARFSRARFISQPCLQCHEQVD